MKLRWRIALWYGTVLFVAVMIVGWWAYSEIEERNAMGPVAIAEESEGPFDEALEMLLFGALPALAFGLIGGAIITRRVLQPLQLLVNTLEQTHVGNLAEAAPRSGNGDEVDRLTMVFNSLKLRLAGSFEHAREFTLHASHELKTPVTIMHSTLERMLKPGTTLPEIQERCGVLIEEVQRLSGIVTQLAFLAQADSGQQGLQLAPVPLHELVTEASEDAVLLAANAGVTVEVDANEECVLDADRMRIRQLLLIVLDNAVKHNVKAGKVSIALRRSASGAALCVTNTGPPMNETERGRVFERFFRGVHARDAGTEGSGLGLSIAELIVRAHGGRIQFESVPEGRYALMIELPFTR